MVYLNKNVMMEGVRVLPGTFRNFGGLEARYNSAGEINFAVELPEDTAKEMEIDGWNIHWPKPKEFEEGEEDTRLPFIKVKIKYPDPGGKGRPPRIVMVTSRNSQYLGKDDLSVLDFANIIKADLEIAPYNWGPNAFGDSGVSAYLRIGYFTIEEDYLQEKYARLEEERQLGANN